MKRLFLSLAVLFFAFSSIAYAHPPHDIKITFDPATKVLTAVIMHDVANPANHYINKVDAGLNGKEIIEQRISRQDNYASQTVSWLIPDVKDGDTLSVEAYCSISGKLKKEITAGSGR
ncbi:MAG: hypothetical protein V1869_06085 [Candidatus Omnitrophota bacterium]